MQLPRATSFSAVCFTFLVLSSVTAVSSQVQAESAKDNSTCAIVRWALRFKNCCAKIFCKGSKATDSALEQTCDQVPASTTASNLNNSINNYAFYIADACRFRSRVRAFERDFENSPEYKQLRKNRRQIWTKALAENATGVELQSRIRQKFYDLNNKRIDLNMSSTLFASRITNGFTTAGRIMRDTCTSSKISMQVQGRNFHQEVGVIAKILEEVFD